MHRRRFLVLAAAGSVTALRVDAQTKKKTAAKPPPLPPAILSGPSAVEAIRAMLPGQYLWAPDISPAGPVLAIVSRRSSAATCIATVC